MRLTIDTDRAELEITGDDQPDRVLPLYSREAFELISRQWVVVGWDQKYPYTFSWLGRPIIQLPEDLLRVQEVIHRIAPDVLIETGVAHGGSLVFYASIFEAMKKGRVVGVDIEIRPHNREALETHDLYSRITLIEGSSIDPGIVERAKKQIQSGDSVLVMLDSNHSRAHVLAELEAYHDVVTPGSYIVAADGVMEWVADTPRGESDWHDDNPISAVEEFLAGHPEFVLEQPEWPFNESALRENITHWPSAWLRRR